MSARIPSPLVSRVLDICVRQLGSLEVAKRLGVTPVLLDMWCTRHAPMPQPEFLKLVDLLITLDPGWEDWDRDIAGPE